jgi:DNA-directed RNA polymerase specialized sigma24 family protein
MTFLDDNFALVSAVALQAARAVRKRYPNADVDDLTQVGLMWCVEHPKKLREYVSSEQPGKLYVALHNYVKAYARSDRAEREGYVLEDEAFYSKRMLKGDGTNPGLLHYVWDRANWEKPPSRGEGAGRSKGDPAEGGTWLAIMCDVDKALKSLSADDQALLRLHYKDGETYEAIRINEMVSKTTVATNIDRAVAKMQDFLGGAKPREDEPEDGWDLEPEYVGTRRAISNAHARAITENQQAVPQHLPTR